MRYLKTYEELQKVLRDKSRSGKTTQYDLIYDEPSDSKSPSSLILLNKELRSQEFQDLIGSLGANLPKNIVKAYLRNPDDKKLEALLVTINNMRFLLDKSKEGELRCEYCGRGPLVIYGFDENFNPKNGATCDHKDPQSKGGDKFNYSNLAVCCRRCNKEKGNIEYQDWMSKLES